MTLKIYDSATRSLRDFEPLVPGKVGIYICGLTVQGSPHIGHVRFTVAFDQLRSWLEVGHGYDVTLVRNVTDVDDKIINKARRAKEPWWAWAYKHERETTAALEALGVRPATYEPRATGHMQEIVSLIERLIERGHAYRAIDGTDDVYFDVRSWDGYGELTRQQLDDLAPATDGKAMAKKDPRDFALWKGRPHADYDDPVWPSPWGWGRPGWHIECSAMAHRYLGEEFDIHGGGVDLRFPHHENEIAQSCAAGYNYAQYWMHNAWVTMSGEKMSKSLGNSVVVTELVKTVRPLVLRYYLGSAQYRSTIEFSPESLTEAATTVARLETFLRRGQEVVEPSDIEAATSPEYIPQEFADAMNDDLNIPGALAVVFDTLRAGNAALDAGNKDEAKAAVMAVICMTDILGVNPLSEHWSGKGSSADESSQLEESMGGLIQGRLDARDAARADKDYAAADAIRDELVKAGIIIEDTPDGARWRLG